MNILDALYEDGITPVYKASTKGGEYVSPCPKCDGKDRFIIWPEQNRFWCRNCKITGGPIDYMKQIRRLTFSQAKEKAGYPSQYKYYCIEKKQPSQVKEKEPRSSEWFTQAKLFIEESESNLLDLPQGYEDLIWLQEEKRINTTTARLFKLGLNYKNLYVDRKIWGLQEEYFPNAKKKDLFIPKGLVIPSISQNGIINNIRIRRPEGHSRYYALPGSSMNYLVTGNIESDVCFIVESDLDAILLHQEAGDLACFIATGSTSNKPGSKDYAFIASKKTAFISFDTDNAGMMAANGYWLPNFANAKRWLVQNGKDPSDAFKNGLELYDWVNAAIYL